MLCDLINWIQSEQGTGAGSFEPNESFHTALKGSPTRAQYSNLVWLVPRTLL